MATGYNSPTAFEETVSAVTATNSVELGERRWSDGIEYVYCYNAGGEDIPAPGGCTVSAVTGYSVTVSSVSGENLLAGVNLHNTLTTGQYGWIGLGGQANVSGNTQTLIAIGTPLQMGDDGTFSTAVAGFTCGYAASAMTVSAGAFNIYYKSQIW